MKKITVFINRYDLFRAHLVLLPRNPIAVFTTGMLSIMYTFPIPEEILNEGTLISVVLTIAALGLNILIFGFLFFLLMWMHEAFLPFSSRGKLGLHELRLADKGLVEKTSVNETTLPYSEVKLVKFYKKGILIQIKNRSGFWLPLKSKESSEKTIEFANELLQHIKTLC